MAAVVGAVGVRLRQPLIVAFIAVGFFVGPSPLGWVSANDQVDLLAELEIALLLFVVGLITISASTYMILYSHPLYERVSHWLDVFERTGGAS